MTMAILLMYRDMDDRSRQQSLIAEWNVLGYGNNGIREHAVEITIT